MKKGLNLLEPLIPVHGVTNFPSIALILGTASEKRWVGRRTRLQGEKVADRGYESRAKLDSIRSCTRIPICMAIRMDGSCPMGDAAYAGLIRYAIFVTPPPKYSPFRELPVWCFSQTKPTRAAFVFIQRSL
jgi:hypothetical protein